MLDKQIYEAMSFLDTIYSFTINAEELEFASEILGFLIRNKKYTPNFRVLISKQLIYDILDAEIGFAKESEQEGQEKNTAIFDLDKQGKPPDYLVDNTWKQIYNKYICNGIYKVILNEQFISNVIETGIDVWLNGPEPKKEALNSKDSTKKVDKQQSPKDLSLEVGSEILFTIKHEDKKTTEELILTTNPHKIFDKYLIMAMEMTIQKKYAEALQLLHQGVAYLQTFFSSGEPVLKDVDNGWCIDFLIRRDDGETMSSYPIFNEIDYIISVLESIPEEEATMQERKKIIDMLRFIVIKLEEWQIKAMIE